MDKPWTYHMFGSFADPEMMLLTEDDFFDYLIASKNLLLPSAISAGTESPSFQRNFTFTDLASLEPRRTTWFAVAI